MISWTGMITTYSENECFDETLKMFSTMRRRMFIPNSYTFAGVLRACVGLNALDLGEGVHGLVLKNRYETDKYVTVGLLELYTQFDHIDVALRVFDEMPTNDGVTWSFMITRYAQSGYSVEALNLFAQMKKAFVAPNNFTYASVFQACSNLRALFPGKQIHSLVVKVGFDSNVFVSNALLDFYAKCGLMETSLKLFSGSENQNDVTWNTMIVGYASNGSCFEALSMMKSMLRLNFPPSEVTYTSALRACASVAAMEMGVQLHAHAVKTTYARHNFVANSLIDMYAKCGSINKARISFEKFHEKDEVSWNAMIAGYSAHGLGKEALTIFEKMKETQSSPTDLTFVGVLSACSNSGLLEEGQHYFQSMIKQYSIQPCMEHYTCMVSLYGRTGHLKKATNLIERMPFPPGVMIWRALLGACAIHKNVHLGSQSAKRILEIEPQDESAHVLLSNIYAAERMWAKVASVRKEMKASGVRKEPGLSWVECHRELYYFQVGDTSHPDIRVIRGMLEWLRAKASRAGHVTNYDTVLLNMDDDEKAKRVWLHSERLAVAWGLFRSFPGSDIRIMKNLRICADCHAVMKVISKVSSRRIVIRDMNRFHHMHDGACSCGDYW